MNLTITSISLLLSAAILSAGAPATNAAPQPDVLPSDGYVVTHWGPNNGLPTADTWPIIQTREGYIWVGTGFGIVRFDGMKFTPFNSRNSPAFRAQQVTAIHEDTEGRIWVGLLSGGVLIHQNGRFTTPPSCDTINYQSVDGIFSDSSGSVYLCTSIGVLRVNGDSATFLDDLPEIPRFGFSTPDGALYFAGDSLIRKEHPSGPWKTVVSGEAAMPFISDALLEPSGLLSVLRQGEIRRYRLTPDGTFIAGETIRTPGALRMMKDGENGYFVGTVGYGLVYLNGTSVSHPHGLGVQRGAGRQVHAIMRDNEGGIWTTTSGGLYRFSRSFFTILGADAGFAHDYAWLVRLQKDGTLWMGVGIEGVYRWKNGTITLLRQKDGMPDDHVTELFESADGSMWFGGQNGGVVSMTNGVFRHYEQLPGYRGGRVLSISKDHTDRIWVGTRRALHILEGGRFKVFTGADSKPLSGVRNVVHAPGGDLWYIVSATVHRIRDGRTKIFSMPRGSSYFGATAMMLDGDHVWFGTYGGGLYLIRGDSVVNLNDVCPGLGPRILAIHEDRHGYLWINAERELQRVRKAEMLAALGAPGRTVPIEVYDRLDGLTDIEFNRASVNSSQQLPDGRLLYASTSGIVAVNPDAAARPTAPPPVRIERIVADGVEYPAGGRIALPPDTRRVEIAFSALRFQSPGRVRFRYKLTGIDRDWVASDGPERIATYTNPGHGSYIFSVASSVYNGPWSGQPAGVSFVIAPYFYERPWVQAGGLLVLLALTGIAYRMRTTRFLRRNRQLEEEIQRRVQAEALIRSSLEEKTVMLKEIHHRVKNNMQIISSLFSLQLGNSRDPVIQEMLRESQIRIRSMALVHESLYRSNNLAAIDFREYVEGLAGQIAHAHRKRNVHLSFTGDPITLSIEQAIPAGLIMNELLSNAYKHAFPNDEPGTITVYSRNDSGTHVELVVADNGPGLPVDFDPATVSSLGFHLITSLAEQLGGTLALNLQPGATIRIRFPIAQ